MALEVPLERLQRWMQAVVVHPGSEDEAVASPEAEAELPAQRIGEVILPSRSLTPVERVGIYHGMYLLRMEEALASDYTALKHYLGDHAFFELVRDYVQVHPSRDYTLNRLGDAFPDFVRRARLRRPEFCHELARLEQAVAHVFDAGETPPLSEEQIGAVAPDAWERARLQPVEAFRLLSLSYPVNAYLQTVRDESHDHPQARRKDIWVAVYRRNLWVFRLDLTRAAHDLLADLAAGTRLGDAIQAALQSGGRHAPSGDALFRWFREWVRGGMFRSVEVS